MDTPLRRFPATLLLVLVAWAITPSGAWAQTERAERRAREGDTFRIDAIVVEGLFLTHPNVVTRELLFGEGETVRRAEIEESVQRLRNLGIFRIAEYELLDRRIPLPDGSFPNTGDAHRILLIRVDERWTLIPFGTFAAGGGAFSLTTGLYDINLLGRYIELGGQYQHFAGTNSFAVWASDPRFLGRRLRLSGTAAQTNRINVFYRDDGDLEGGHLQLRRSASAALTYEWVRWLRTGVSLSYVDDRYSTDLLSDELVELELQRGLPSPAHYLTAGVTVSLGRLDADDFLRKGFTVGWGASAARRGLASNLDYLDQGVGLVGFLILPLRANFGVRAGLGTTSVDRPEYEYFVGGLNILRGFRHRRFRGSHYWYANAELRVPSVATRWLVVQHVGFLDSAGVGADSGAFAQLDGMAGGVGLRILSPKIFSLIARFDYAWSLVGDGRSALSFGAGQFF